MFFVAVESDFPVVDYWTNSGFNNCDLYFEICNARKDTLVYTYWRWFIFRDRLFVQQTKGFVLISDDHI